MIFNVISTLFTLSILIFTQTFEINVVALHCTGKRIKASPTTTKEPQILNINPVLFDG